MNLLLTLLLAHLIADFPLQTNEIFRLKVRHWYGILLHAGIHAIVTAALIINPLEQWSMLLLLWLIHFAIDWLKLRIKFKIQSIGFVLDQIAHILSLIFIAYWATDIQGALPTTFLFIALLYAQIPAALVFLAIISVDLKTFHGRFPYLRKIKGPQAVSLALRMGSPLVAAVLLVRILVIVWPAV